MLKLGRRPPKNAPALRLGSFLRAGVIPEHPVAADHLGRLDFGLYENDRYGDCGPTAVANLYRLVTAGLLGVERAPSQDDVFDLYRRSGNPAFDPATGTGDGGVDMQTMLEALLAGGIGGVRPVAFAKVDAGDDDELAAAVSIFGGVLWGVDLQRAQQQQSLQGTWDYAASADWGGHAVLHGAYGGEVDTVVTWGHQVRITTAFRQHQLQEAWIVVWAENVLHPAFQQGVDIAALASAYQALTGRPFPAQVPGVPAPADGTRPSPGAPTPATAADGTLTVGPFDSATLHRLSAAAAGLGKTVETYVADLLRQV
jgi:hypothetical protein